jgi:hypothetical protein
MGDLLSVAAIAVSILIFKDASSCSRSLNAVVDVILQQSPQGNNHSIKL